ncbi:MAG: hypothetical protein LBI05_02805 [Planctomycetaceae bacterium]|jgi:hypothetical protein|nr:hypothetical protein [Planctomycetaceae bacterium]
MIRLIARCLLGVGVWLCQFNVSAQDAVTSNVEKKGETIIRQTPVDYFYLDDIQGKRFVSSRIPLTTIDDFYNYILKDQQNPIPTFILRNVSATGKVVGKYVEVDVQIEFLTTGHQHVRVPLGFKEGILPRGNQTDQSPFRYTGSGVASLIVDPQEGQYVAVVTPQTQQAGGSETPDTSETPEIDQRHTISLLLWFPLIQNGGENRLSLSFPQSNSSQFLLTIPMCNVAASVTRGLLLDQQENIERQSTTLNIQGLRTDSDITWGKKPEETIDDRPILLIEEALIDVQIDTQSTVYDVTLPVRSTTGSFDQLQIRLPQGCVLDREFTNRYSGAGGYSVSYGDRESIVTVGFPQKTAGPVSLRLKGTQRFDRNEPDFRRDLTGFDVLGAERQSGTLTVSSIPSDMTLRWEPVSGIRRSDADATSTLASMVSAMGNTRFDFISQSFLLRVRMVSPQIRIIANPMYRFHISKGTITLDAQISYTVSGAKTDVLYFQLPDSQWDYDFGTSGTVVDVTSVTSDASGLLTIPLRSSTEGPINIEIKARRSVAPADGQQHRLVLPLPQPEQVSWSEPAPVVIVFDKDTEVTPIDDSYPVPSEQRTSGLTRQTRQTMQQMRVDITDLQQPPLYYRAESPSAVFVADLSYHQMKMNTTMQTNVHLSEDDNRVTQTITYETAYAPVGRLYFFVPKSLLEPGGDIKVQWENQPLELQDSDTGAWENIPEDCVVKFVGLRDPMFQFQLTFQYSSPLLNIPAGVSTRFALPFICPTEVPVSDHRIHFSTSSGYRIELQNDSKLLWEPFREPHRFPLTAVESFRSVQSPTRIMLLIHAPEKSAFGSITVERAWLQTWLTSGLRVDRATYLVRTSNDSVTLRLPQELTKNNLVVRVERQKIDPDQLNISHERALTIPILPEQQNLSIEIFVEYRFSFDMSGVEVPLRLPYFVDSEEILMQHQFWQVILQQNQHIISGPAGWTLEYYWAWNKLFWWRAPSTQKSEIGFISDPEVIEPMLSETSQYVFSHFQPSPNVVLYVVKRSWIILGSSSLALLIGLILIYVPQSRYIGSLFGLGVALVSVLIYQPSLVLLMLQAAVFGVFLALGTAYVYRIFHRQQQWIPPTFSMVDDRSPSYFVPSPPSQTVHEVVMDEETTGKDGDTIPTENNGQS